MFHKNKSQYNNVNTRSYLLPASLNSGQPEILTNSETVTIYANDNYTLHCQGHRPLKWTLPKVEVRVFDFLISPRRGYKSGLNINQNFVLGDRVMIRHLEARP